MPLIEISASVLRERVRRGLSIRYRVPEAVAIGRRTLRIARQSILAGLGLSAAAMVIASLGFLVPAAGAVVQEVIDVAVILNALRTTKGPGAS